MVNHTDGLRVLSAIYLNLYIFFTFTLQFKVGLLPISLYYVPTLQTGRQINLTE